MTQQNIPVSQQVLQLTQQLTNALQRGVDIDAQKDAVTKEIAALRNVIAGIQLGQALQKEIDAPPNGASTK